MTAFFLLLACAPDSNVSFDKGSVPGLDADDTFWAYTGLEAADSPSNVVDLAAGASGPGCLLHLAVSNDADHCRKYFSGGFHPYEEDGDVDLLLLAWLPLESAPSSVADCGLSGELPLALWGQGGAGEADLYVQRGEDTEWWLETPTSMALTVDSASGGSLTGALAAKGVSSEAEDVSFTLGFTDSVSCGAF